MTPPVICLDIFFFTAKTETWGEKRNQNKEEEKGKEERATDNKGWTLIKKKFQGGGLGHFGLHVFHIKYIFVNSNVLCIVSFPDQNEILVSI